jgi:hypothetical protein
VFAYDSDGLIRPVPPACTKQNPVTNHDRVTFVPARRLDGPSRGPADEILIRETATGYVNLTCPPGKLKVIPYSVLPFSDNGYIGTVITGGRLHWRTHTAARTETVRLGASACLAGARSAAGAPPAGGTAVRHSRSQVGRRLRDLLYQDRRSARQLKSALPTSGLTTHAERLVARQRRCPPRNPTSEST